MVTDFPMGSVQFPLSKNASLDHANKRLSTMLNNTPLNYYAEFSK